MQHSNPHISPEWPGKLHRKIDIYEEGKYACSSNAYKNLTDAINGYAFTRGYSSLAKISAHYSYKE